PVTVERVGADPVTQERTAALAAGGVDCDDRDPQLVLLVHAQPADELVSEAGLAGAAGARDAEHGRVVGTGRLPEPGERGLVEASLLRAGDRARDGGPVAGEHPIHRGSAD